MNMLFLQLKRKIIKKSDYHSSENIDTAVIDCNTVSVGSIASFKAASDHWLCAPHTAWINMSSINTKHKQVGHCFGLWDIVDLKLLDNDVEHRPDIGYAIEVEELHNYYVSMLSDISLHAQQSSLPASYLLIHNPRGRKRPADASDGGSQNTKACIASGAAR